MYEARLIMYLPFKMLNYQDKVETWYDTWTLGRYLLIRSNGIIYRGLHHDVTLKALRYYPSLTGSFKEILGQSQLPGKYTAFFRQHDKYLTTFPFILLGGERHLHVQ